MSQVTQSLIDEWKRALGRKLTPAFTINEFDQLCFAWEECQRLRSAAQKARTALSSLIASGDRVVFSDALRALDDVLGEPANSNLVSSDLSAPGRSTDAADEDRRDAARWRALDAANEGMAMFPEHADVSFRLPECMTELEWDTEPLLAEIADALAASVKGAAPHE